MDKTRWTFVHHGASSDERTSGEVKRGAPWPGRSSLLVTGVDDRGSGPAGARRSRRAGLPSSMTIM
ncbi:hypothetical protein DSY14_13205 [Nocardiopsis sp. MG754419]|nr:hypothetical protein [Nocardiopsis sp. MG754419]